MDLSSKLILDTSKIHLKLVDQNSFNVVNFEDSNDDFSDYTVKNINVFEYEMVDISDLEQEQTDR